MAVPQNIIDKIWEMRETGKTIQAIAEKLNLPRGTVDYQINKYGIESPKTASTPPTVIKVSDFERKGHLVRRFTPEQDAIIQRLALTGASTVEIGKKLGRGHNSILGRMRRLARHEERRLNTK